MEFNKLALKFFVLFKPKKVVPEYDDISVAYKSSIVVMHVRNLLYCCFYLAKYEGCNKEALTHHQIEIPYKRKG